MKTIKSIRWILVLYLLFTLAEPPKAAPLAAQAYVGKEVLEELLPVWNRLRDLIVLLDSAPSPSGDVKKLKDEIQTAISELDKAIYRLDAEYTPETKAVFENEAEKVREQYSSKEREWRKRVMEILGRDDLPYVSVPLLTDKEKEQLYSKYLRLAEKDNCVERAKGARGMGAIGEKKGIPALIKMLFDPVEDVRVKAITSLAWLQATEAVPLLSELLQKDTNKWIKRRCAQALGQIGNKSAVPLLMKYIENEDPYLAENAILALGWLQAKEAVDELIKVLEERKVDLPVREAWQQAVSPSACAAIALGCLGDRKALEPLREVCRTCVYPMPFGKKAGKYELLYMERNCARSLEGVLKNSAVYALNCLGDDSITKTKGSRFYFDAEEIKAGRKESLPGIKQPDFSAHPSFYDFSRNTFMRAFHALAFPAYVQEKTIKTVSGYKIEELTNQDLPFLYRLAASSGANIWRLLWTCALPDSYSEIRKRLEYQGKIGLKDQIFHPGSTKADITALAARYGDLPALQSIEREEWEFSLTVLWRTGEKIDDRFKQYLSSKYTEDELKSFGIDLDKVHIPPLKSGHFYPPELSPVLFTEYNDMCDENFLEFFKELGQFIHMLRRGTDCRYAFSQRYANGYPGRYLELSDVVDSSGPENGSDQVDAVTSFWTELGRNGEARSSYIFHWPGVHPYKRPSPSEEYVEKGMASGLAHSQGILAWDMKTYYYWADALFGAPPPGTRFYRNNKMDVIAGYFKLAGKTEPYLVKTRIATPLALLFSERTGRSPFYAKINPSGYANDYSNMQTDIWKKLLEAHIPGEPIIVETIAERGTEARGIESAKLSPYKVCILANGRTLTEAEEETLRKYVRGGGVLIATSQTTLYDRWGRKKKDYGLADVFGASYENDGKGCMRVEIKQKSETLQKLIPENLNKCFLSKNGASFNYDSVKDIKGEVIAKYENGVAAVILHRFGGGYSVFFAGSLSNLDSPGWAELLKWTLDGVNAKLPVEAIDASAAVEVVPRLQLETGRIIIHLVNWTAEDGTGVETRSSEGKNVITLKLNLPDAGRMFYSSDGKEIAPGRKDGDLIISVRNFKTYEMIVVEKK
ncbi:MAG: HEAT repeat domain-containing protein [Kiritimatiellae bacterium]|nr:HEAT repeat domain-containing protein [Kiritimatiellia bacterium]